MGPALAVFIVHSSMNATMDIPKAQVMSGLGRSHDTLTRLESWADSRASCVYALITQTVPDRTRTYFSQFWNTAIRTVAG